MSKHWLLIHTLLYIHVLRSDFLISHLCVQCMLYEVIFPVSKHSFCCLMKNVTICPLLCKKLWSPPKMVDFSLKALKFITEYLFNTFHPSPKNTVLQSLACCTNIYAMNSFDMQQSLNKILWSCVLGKNVSILL